MTGYLLTRGQCFRVLTRKRRTLKGRSLGTIQRTLTEFSCLCRSGEQDSQSFDDVVLSDWGHFSDIKSETIRIAITLIETISWRWTIIGEGDQAIEPWETSAGSKADGVSVAFVYLCKVCSKEKAADVIHDLKKPPPSQLKFRGQPLYVFCHYLTGNIKRQG